ncbi:NAD-dependent epimerase/dehydratase family protein [Gordonia sp. HNM0687]|uniref:NAD-dependent epimerase/dehydratase family protein n=1 Tax=Gordonia mangrovi TaxID=2665643 RepID=A0A6L7GJS5_9ACTN|nr:UDP-glucuronic acid decarboxylase family protein [Gordonia mangrovi]MXP20154.1 NAD-dependent epimerase/dehydratase family protein [Gordonia mangrovi]UVF79238.1 SDR family oxidoreductase [Gordonia mangrovi]
MRVVITGGAGFIGSHLCQALHDRGDDVVCVDNLASGRIENIAHLLESPRFHLEIQDIRTPLAVSGPVDAVANLASLASPPGYSRRPVFTLTTGSDGTKNALDLAATHQARFVQASTSEVYGDPAIHPQREDYWGNVNPTGPRSMYDEAKRYAEALVAAYVREGVNAGIARIFNTYGPRMRLDDGRVVTNFIAQSLRGEPLTVYGDGGQTRSLCYVSDLVRGLIALIDTPVHGPINLGNPHEMTVLQIAELVRDITGSTSTIEYRPLPQDDPTRRRPDIGRARNELGWQPKVDVATGLAMTINWNRNHRAVEVGAVEVGAVEPSRAAS